MLTNEEKRKVKFALNFTDGGNLEPGDEWIPLKKM